MNWKEKNFDFPGWPVANNPFGAEFDEKARERMIAGSSALLPIIEDYKNDIGKNILEVGPFFNPLVTKENFPNHNICYWENDRHVIDWIEKQNENADFVKPIYCDLNSIDGDSQVELRKETTKFLNKFGNGEKLFDTVVLSQVFNYIDYKLQLMLLRNFVKKDGLIFINNTVDYGIPQFFSKKRPKSNSEIFETLEGTDYEIISQKELTPPTNINKPKTGSISGFNNKRLMIVARRK